MATQPASGSAPTDRSADGRFEAVDPRSGRPLGSFREADRAEVAAAVSRARAAAGEWSNLDYRARSAHLLTIRDRLLDRAEDLVDTIAAATGKPESEAAVDELLVVCETIEHYAKHGAKALEERRASSGLLIHKRAVQRYEPLGVVGVISPWNFPFNLALVPTLTALFAGNTVVLKVSEVTPTVGEAIAGLFEGTAFPDVVQVVQGGAATGDALVRSGVDKICFTGSTRTGRRVMAAAAETLTPVLLELGGKDPLIVCADADLDRAARAAVWGAFRNAGQMCLSVERVYVEDEVYQDFVDRVVEQTLALRQGVGEVDVGSMSNAAQLELVERHIADAEAKGAKVVTGGRRVAGREGLWFEPTVLVDVDHGMQVMVEETFGPVLPIMRVVDDHEAVRLANSTAYGLSSSVFSSNPDRAERLVGQLRSGSVCVNDCVVSYGIADLPFGGLGDSGFGRVHGPDGLREMSRVKAVVAERVSLAREPWWFPVPRGAASATIRTMRLRYGRSWRRRLSALRRHRRR